MPSMPKATIHEERARPSILLMKRIWPVLLAQTLLGCAVAEVGTKPDGLSTGLQRLPYEDKTQVSITNDHVSHRPPKRLDMVGLTK